MYVSVCANVCAWGPPEAQPRALHHCHSNHGAPHQSSRHSPSSSFTNFLEIVISRGSPAWRAWGAPLLWEGSGLGPGARQEDQGWVLGVGVPRQLGGHCLGVPGSSSSMSILHGETGVRGTGAGLHLAAERMDQQFMCPSTAVFDSLAMPRGEFQQSGWVPCVLTVQPEPLTSQRAREHQRDELCPGLTSSQEVLSGRPAGYVELAGAGSSLPLTFLSQQLHLPSLVCLVVGLVGEANSPRRETGCDRSPCALCPHVCCRCCFRRAGSGQANWHFQESISRPTAALPSGNIWHNVFAWMFSAVAASQ